MRLLNRPQPVRNSANWSATLGLAAILGLTTTAWWQLRAEPRGLGNAQAPTPAPSTASPLRLRVSADGAIQVEGEGTPVGLDGLAGRLSGLAPARLVELIIDPRTLGVAVDRVLVRLRDAGVTDCTLREARP